MAKNKYYFILTLLILFIPGCSDLWDTTDYKNIPVNETPLKPTSSPKPNLNSSETVGQPPTKPSTAIQTFQIEYPFSSYCYYYTHSVKIGDHDFVPSEYKKCRSDENPEEFTRKNSWWDYFETLIPSQSSFEWWRLSPGDDWRPAPLEYHDPIGIEISSIVDRVYDLDHWQITSEDLDIGDITLASWHYHYQGDYHPLPSNQIPNEKVKEKSWKEGFVEQFQADIWVSPDGYVIKETLQWEVRYELLDGNLVHGKESITKRVNDLNQNIDLPIFVSPPIPHSLSNISIGKWLEYGDENGIWKYQIAKNPQEVLASYLLSEDQHFDFLSVEGNSGLGYSIVIQDNTNRFWELTLKPKETTKGGVVTVIVISQR